MNASDSRSFDHKGIMQNGYDHASWELRRRFCRFLLKTIAFGLLIKLDQVDGLENFPPSGQAILLMNHIAFVDPIVLVYTSPRFIVPLAKVEVYDYPFIGIFPRLWGVIPVRREEVDRRAVQIALDVLGAGEVILVAPEGTRGTQLQRGKEGMAYLASRSGAPIVPVAIEGTPGFPALRTSARWRGKGVRVHYGRPFRYHPQIKRPRGDDLRKMADEAMYVLAGMLPEERRGVYSDLARASQDTIEWL